MHFHEEWVLQLGHYVPFTLYDTLLTLPQNVLLDDQLHGVVGASSFLPYKVHLGEPTMPYAPDEVEILQ